jgi:hypothetical protein
MEKLFNIGQCVKIVIKVLCFFVYIAHKYDLYQVNLIRNIQKHVLINNQLNITINLLNKSLIN